MKHPLQNNYQFNPQEDDYFAHGKVPCASKKTKYKQMKKTKYFLNSACLLVIIAFVGCEKAEGEGGAATIKGKVKMQNYNSTYTTLIDEYYAPEEDVYIIYGEDEIYSDDFKTHYDGSYEFKYLRSGFYTVYAYSKDSSGAEASGVVPILKTVEITEKDEIVEVDDLVILE